MGESDNWGPKIDGMSIGHPTTRTHTTINISSSQVSFPSSPTKSLFISLTDLEGSLSLKG